MRHTADPASRRSDRRAPRPLGDRRRCGPRPGVQLRNQRPGGGSAQRRRPPPSRHRTCCHRGWRRSAAATAASRLGPSSCTSARPCRTCSSRGAQLSPTAGAARAAAGAGGWGELQGVIDQRLAVWCERQDVIAMSAAFGRCGKLESAHASGPAATAAARAGIIAALAPALLPLVPRIRQPAGCSLPLWALAKAGAAIDGRVESELAPALLQRLVDPVLLDSATPQALANALYALGKLREDQQQRGSGWDPTSSPHLNALASAVASWLRAASGHGFEPQHVSNSLWACAKLGYRDSDLLRPLAEAAAALAPDMNAQGLANSLWALEVLGCTGPAFRAVLETLCGAALRQLRTPKEAEAFKPQHLSNILLALEGLPLGSSATSGPAAAVLSEGGPLLPATAPAATGAGGGLRQLLPLAAWARQAAPAPAPAAPAAAGARSCLLQPGRRAQQQVLAAGGRYGSGGTSHRSIDRSSSSGHGGIGSSRSSSDAGGRAGGGRAGGGRWAGGRTGGAGDRSGGGRRARDPADDMTVCRTLEQLQGVIDQRLAVWCERQDVIAMSAAFGRCGKLEPARAGGPTATAAARAGIIAALAPALLPLVPRIRQPASCSLPLWALAKAGAASDGRVESQLAPALLQRLVDPVLLDSAIPIDLANALYALGKLREDQQRRGSGWDPTSSPHLKALASAVASRLRAARGHGFNAQDVSNSLWACAKLGYRDSDLLRPLAEAAAALAPDMNAQGLANSLWALEVLGCTGPAFRAGLETLYGAALRQLRTPKEAEAFKPQHLSNILLALEGLQLGGKQSERLAAAVAVEAMRRGFAGCNPQELSNSAWALAKMGYGAGATPKAMEQCPWYAAAVAAAQRPGVMASAKPQHWANLLYALALVRHQPPPALLDAGAAAAMQRGKAQECANTLWALAVLQLRNAGLEAAVCGRLGELLQREPESLVAQALCNSLWALAVLAGGGVPASPAASALAPALVREAVRRREEFQTEELRQLWQAQHELGGEVAEALARSPDLLAAMEAAVSAKRATGSTTSSTQEQVAEALQRLLQKGRLPIVSVRMEVVVEGVLGLVDMVADWSDGRRVAIEVDGPDHFLTHRKDDPSAVIGSTALRNRQLRRAFGEGGLLCVPYWEWYGLRTPSTQEAYLLQQLQDLLSGASSGTAAGKGSAAAPRHQQQRTAQPQPDTANSSTTATTTTTASSSQKRRILVVRRKAPKQEAAGGGGAGEASGATAAARTVPAEAEVAAPARQQSAEKAQRLPSSGAGGGAGEGGGNGTPLAPQPPPPQQQRVSAPRARRSSSQSRSRSSQAGSPSPAPPVEAPPPEQVQAAAPPRRAAGGKRTERKAAAAPAAGGGGGGGGSDPGAVVVPAAVSEKRLSVVAGEADSSAAAVECGGGGDGSGGGLPAGSRRGQAVGTGRRAAQKPCSIE
ncbi:hypothetical protein CHLRE_15g638954v5 [Chlamydomonas reinhardtii]|uniref:RAP domain-containing protein n=1 Tax=Chlamydomonas reinhardtii TaxID=3055 RepID=A0A2K3CWS5_CHLRE|nr:uncharacterized protein CHLRE_15g638954v5 [Chlamydomonas reinhardtii]XP_042916493.1 uncharacterized protein CHLRE_15g638954v5 [Chlamydomonas reinhardtii]PNW72727.1 hypothetical protein CHLRE_15g638954v5 [Chlamydomonas reinhardtii]PNW72728.1 hypothetical protein CHLRE_15g638954v5 [Chlamydomonas reinhardtii]